MRQRAVFMDRDGTLVQPRHYPSRPEDLELYPDLGPGLRKLQAAGFLLVLITNQAGLAHGYFGVAELDAMHAHVRQELDALGVALHGVYYCPHHPDGSVPELAIMCDCRKPAPGMLIAAANDLAIDLGASWFLGDILDDVEAGKRAGTRTILVDIGTESTPQTTLRTPDFVAPSTVQALAIIADVEGIGPPAERTYRPTRWTAVPAELVR